MVEEHDRQNNPQLPEIAQTMRRLIIIVPIVLVLVLTALVVVAMLIPKSVYKAQAETAAEAALGRDISLAGDVGLGFFPRISARIEDVSVANPEGFDGEHMIRAGALRASVKWMPLLTGRVEVREVALIDADIRLQKLADGRANWEFASSEPAEAPTPGDEGASLNAGIDQARVVNASVTYSDATTDQAYALTELNAEASVRDLALPLTASGNGKLDGERFAIDITLETPERLLGGSPANAELRLDTDMAAIRYDGNITLGDQPVLAGDFSASIPDIAALAARAALDPASLPVNLAPLGSASLRGSLDGPVETLVIAFEEAAIDGETLDMAYNGSVTLGEVPALAGSLDLSVRDMAATLRALGLDNPQAAALEASNLTFKGKADGPLDALALSGMDFDLIGPLITATYDGALTLGTDGRINGSLAASSQNLRGLLEAAGTVLEPGETLKTFSLTGRTEGSLSQIAINDMTLSLDEATGTGNLVLDMTGARPKLTGALSTGPLDLTPFMGPPPPDQPQGWSDTPLALEGLRAADADISLKSERLKIDKVVLEDADVGVNLANGDLDATINNVTTFGGRWGGVMSIDARQASPRVNMSLTGNSILIENLLQTLTGTDRVAGLGQFALDISSEGDSINDIMNALDGTLSADLANGAIKGINLAQLFRTTGNLRESLTSGSFSLGLSPGAETDFTSFVTRLNIRDGVASIETMNMVNPVLGARGLGTIGLGDQTLNMGLQFAADRAGQGNLSDVQLNGLGIPLKITGSWTSPRIVPDTQVLTQALVGGQVNRLQDAAGGILSGVLGGSQSAPTGEDGGEGTEAEPAAPTPEERVEDAAREALGGLFGRNRERDE